MTEIDWENFMTDDIGYDRDNRWGVGGELVQKAGYYNYYGYSMNNVTHSFKHGPNYVSEEE